MKLATAIGSLGSHLIDHHFRHPFAHVTDLVDSLIGRVAHSNLKTNCIPCCFPLMASALDSPPLRSCEQASRFPSRPDFKIVFSQQKIERVGEWAKQSTRLVSCLLIGALIASSNIVVVCIVVDS
jgi:hypothetical protein